MNDTEQDSKNDKMSFAGRTTLNFGELLGNKTMVAHFGLAGFDAEYNITPTTTSGNPGTGTTVGQMGTTNGSILAFRTPGRGLSNIFAAQIGGVQQSQNLQSANSNSTSQVKSSAVGLEGALAFNNIKFQGEYARAGYTGQTGTTGDKLDLTANVFYGEVMYLATGETYAGAYKGGAFGSIKPTNNFDLDKNQWGAWEFGLRAEKYIVDDFSLTAGSGGTAQGVGATRVRGATSCESGAGGTQSVSAINGCKASSTTYTAGIKWILNPNAMVKLNYSRTNFGYEWEHFDLNDTRRMSKEDLIMMRTQFTF
jgi:phosphate-selective porin OprO/OprP